MENSKFVVEDMTVSYYGNVVLDSVSFSVTSGKLIGIIGPNGAGKSSLLKGILGLVNSSSKSITFNGESIKTLKRRIAYVRQRADYDLDFPMQVKDMVLLGTFPNIGLFKRPNKTHKKAAMEALKLLEMHEFHDRQLNDLSGGQLQRVFLARVIVQNADLVFLDEPFTGIDAYSEEKIIQILKNMRDDGKTIIMVYHDLNKVSEYFDEIVIINKKVIASGEIMDTFTKENISTAYESSLLEILNER